MKIRSWQKEIIHEDLKPYVRVKNVSIKRQRLPSGMIKTVERKTRKKYKKQPILYVFKPKRGKRFSKKKTVGNWMGANFVTFEGKKI